MADKLVIGNWKMHGRHAFNAQLVAQLLASESVNRSGVAIAVPTPYLVSVESLLGGQGLVLAAQDVSRFAEDGAFTGESSANMLADVGCRYVLVGHSERRQYLGEGSEALSLKLRNAIAAGLTPVYCVGETLAEREADRHLAVIREQLSVLDGVDGGPVVVAYEPVWAIGTGKVASLEQIDEIHREIKAECLRRLKGSANIRVLYGGSVKADNAMAILSLDNVDGALVGGASLVPESFSMICQTARKLI
ncbi:triose-phosphate isomerase [Pseudogulbenkiania sp. NH8B]|uniref:triose-phosphate isomerase n=1 Tax=Pseudogulbenkiania sp. (strain NH8B) TaxID=748280 RepID=UPI000A012623|nr:triose-phosphate isomerase [Pseudogulbenkiania sp. NH8B]